MPRYLADTTIWILSRGHPRLREKLARRAAAGELLTCAPVALEFLHGAREADEYEEYRTRLARLDSLPLSAEVGERALDVQRGLAHTTHGAHRIPAMDYLIAALAEKDGPDTVLWHVDRELARICDFIGHPHERERAR